MTFELAIKQLGGDSVNYAGPIDGREPGEGRSRGIWNDGRSALSRGVFSHSTIEELARWVRVPVINALSDRYQPCQALADVVQTIKECFGRWDGLKLAFVGDGNNVAHSLMLTAGRLGMHVCVATPRGYEPDPNIVATAGRAGEITVTNDPREAVAGAHVVYTDVWASMGQESEADCTAEEF